MTELWREELWPMTREGVQRRPLTIIAAQDLQPDLALPSVAVSASVD